MYLVARKDAQLELRNREVVASALVFGVMLVVILNFAFNITPERVSLLAPGTLWIAFSFAGALAMSRAFLAEKENDCFSALLLAPVSRDAIFFGKALALFLFVAIIEAALLPIFGVLFGFSFLSWEFIAALILATIGFATLGAFFSALSCNLRSREMMLPILFFPLVSPLIIAAVEVTSAAITGDAGVVGGGRWLQLIGVFNAVFLVVCPWLFTLVVDE